MTNWKRKKGISKNRLAIIVLIVILGSTSLFNIMFMLHTASKLTNTDKGPVEIYGFGIQTQSPMSLPSALYWKKEKASTSITENKYLEIEVLSSKNNVTVTLNGQQHLDTSEMLIRGMNVVVLHEVTGAVMSSRWFDTYESKEDSGFLMAYLQGLRHGRIICFAIKWSVCDPDYSSPPRNCKTSLELQSTLSYATTLGARESGRLQEDEASFHLNENVRVFIKSLGSSYVSQIKWRTMWAFVVQRLKTHNIVYGESFQNSPGHEKWGEPVRLRTTVKLLSEIHVKCPWDDSQASVRRREFCDKYEGYSQVCNCDDPLSLHFNPPAFQDGSRLKLPLAVMASNRPSYLLRMLLSLRNVDGLDPSLVTVFIDGFFDEPSSVAKLFGLNVEQHAGAGRLNSRISQHYKKSLTSSFARHPDANYLVILEEDLYMSVDILSYFKQLLPVLENDESVYCLSAWNDQGYDHLSNDPAMMYRVETMPGLGWVLSRKLFKGELEKKWPKPEQPNDWDMWMRMESNKKGRECIIPDISRTYHFGAKGLNVGSFMQTIYFKKHSLNKERNVKLDVDKMYKDNYEKEMFRLIGEAKLLNHSKNPCRNLKDFVPDTAGGRYLFYLRMDNPRDYTTWSNVARCFRMWDLDPRGFHKSTWRFWIKKNHILAVGCPASVYCKTKPQELQPIYLPDKETRPKDPV